MLPRDPREVSRDEAARLLADLEWELEQAEDGAKADAKRWRDRKAELRMRIRGTRDYVRGRKGAQAPLPMDTDPKAKGGRDA